MAATTATTAPPATTASAESPTLRSAADLSARQWWRRHRAIPLVIAVVIVGAVITSLANSSSHQDTLDPRSYESTGTHALAALLAQRGVRIDTETSTTAAVSAASRAATLVVVDPERLSDAEVAAIARTPADLIVVGAQALQLQTFGLPVTPATDADSPATVAPNCALPAAHTAGPAYLGIPAYRAATGVGCYPINDGHALLDLAGPRHNRVILFADATPLTNANLAKQGNAALALGLFDVHPRIVWLVPPIAHVAGPGQVSVSSLLPRRLKWALVQLIVAVAVIAVWRGRRFGRLIAEALPVVVRQAETVVGRGGLYRRSGSLDAAAAALRTGTRRRLARRLGVATSAPDGVLIDTVASRTGRAPATVRALLYGPSPADDRELVALARDLALVEQIQQVEQVEQEERQA